MKILYSQIKELIPNLKADPKEVGQALTLTGFMMDSFVEVAYKGKKDYLIGLEIRQNRAECLSVIGLAREVAAYFNTPIIVPTINFETPNHQNLDIKINASEYVKRVLAIKIDNIINKESPEWLREYLSFYGLNSINLLVDISNYVMIFAGYPSHLIDCKKINGQISWTLNNSFNEMVTLFKTDVKLQKNNELIIKDEKNIIALAGLIGGQAAAIDMNTTSIIAEIAVYDRSIVRKNSRSLSIVTEASHRLEKDLDPNNVEYAMNLLGSLIIKYGGGQASTKYFDFYPKKYNSPTVEFDPSLSSKIAGIEISEDDTLKIFAGLNFKVEKKDNFLLVTPPTYRLDLSIPEDLAEEVIRVYGYDRIPSNEVQKVELVKDITPKNIILAEQIRDILSNLGFDEILSWPLTKNGDNDLVNYLDWEELATQNSVNDVYPNLRQSIIAGLWNQLNEYLKKNVDFINIFEIGKVFGKKEETYLEKEMLGLIATSSNNSFPLFKDKVETLLRLLGINDIKYLKAKIIPKMANPNSCWDIYFSGKLLGIIYKAVPQDTNLNVYSAELSIDKIVEIIITNPNNPIVEITQKLISLDANIELDNNDSIFENLEIFKKKILKEKDCIWSVNIVDVYPLEHKTRYTVRVSYKELSDQEAKDIHSKVFGLK